MSIKKFNIILILLLLIGLSINVVSANEDVNITGSSENINLEISNYSQDVMISMDEDILESSTYTVTKDNYNQYFDSNGNLISSKVNSGDTINFDGSFSNSNFIFDKQVNVVGTSSNSMSNCVFTFSNGASGSSLSNLHISNTANLKYGIFLNGASNCIIKNCVVRNTGQSSYAVCVGNGANFNNITNNDLTSYGVSYTHSTRSTPVIVVSGSHYNYIADNNINCDDSNGIYLSSYDGGPLKGGVSNYNVIYNNTVKYNVLPTSWSYGIQIMGANNTIKSNKIIGAYRGISTSSGSGNIITDNRIINCTGADYNNPTVEVGGEYAIVGSSKSVIKNNYIINAKLTPSSSAIYGSANSTIENNYIEVSSSGRGIEAAGSNVAIKNNTIFVKSGSGIYHKDASTGLSVESNTINCTSGIGILIEHYSRNMMPSNITIINNIVNTSNNVAIDASQANKSSYVIEGNIVNKKTIKTPEGEIDTSRPIYKFDGVTYNITSENYNVYINENGGLSSTIKEGDILSFSGEFSNKVIFVNTGVKITGNNAIFYNSTFKITSGNVWIENLNITNKKANRLNAWGILVYKSIGVTVFNNTIEVYDPNAAYAVYVLESECVDVINNTLFSSSSDYLTYTLLGLSVIDCKFIGNKVTTIGCGEIYGYEAEKCIDGNESCLDCGESCIDGDENCLDGESCIDGGHIIKEIFRTYGILLIYSSNNEISDNTVSVSSLLNESHATVGANGSSNSIVGIDIYFNSNNNIVSNNFIVVSGKDNYIYGMGVLGVVTGHDSSVGGSLNNQFIKNNVILEGTYFTTGFIAGDGSKNTTIKDNTFDIVSENIAYGITLEMSQNSTIEKNTLTLNSDVVYGIQGYSSNYNKISDNEIDAKAKQALGIALSNSNRNAIIKNNITANGTGEEVTFRNFDSIEWANAGLYLKSHSDNNIITNNEIKSNKGYSIMLDEVALNNTITNNYLESEMGNGNSAIDNNANNNISDNYANFINGVLSDVVVRYLEETLINFTSNVEGAKVSFYSNGVLLGESEVSGGVAALKFRFNQSFIPSAYIIKAIVSKENFKTQEFESYLTINKGILNVSVRDISVKDGLKANFKATVTNALGEPVSGLDVEYYRDVVTTTNYYGEATTDENGIASAILTTTYGVKATSVIASIKGNDYYESIISSGKMNFLNKAPVTITINTNVYYGGVLVTIKDNNGFAVANQKVSIKIGSKSHSLSTTSSGTVTLPKTNKGTYSVSVSYGGNNYYSSGKASKKVSVKSIITGNKNYSTYYGNTVTYKLRILDKNGKAVGQGKVVKVKVNGKKYSLKTDKNGYVSKTVKFKNGKYTITSSYGGYSVSNKITFKPIIISKNLSKKQSKTTKYSVKLVDKKGKILKYKKIAFKIKGKTFYAKTNTRGIATANIKLTLNVGKHTIISYYAGCKVSNKIIVRR